MLEEIVTWFTVMLIVIPYLTILACRMYKHVAHSGANVYCNMVHSDSDCDAILPFAGSTSVWHTVMLILTMRWTRPSGACFWKCICVCMSKHEHLCKHGACICAFGPTLVSISKIVIFCVCYYSQFVL